MPNGVEDNGGYFDASIVAEDSGPFDEFFTDGGWVGDSVRGVAAGIRGECLSVRLPGIPFGEHIARTSDWWGNQIVSVIGSPAAAARRLHDCVSGEIQRFVGVDLPTRCADDDKPRLEPREVEFSDEFMVQIPGWQDVFRFNNEAVFDEQSRSQRAQDYAEALQRSPAPPSMQEIIEILTTLDDLQDEAATLAVVLMIAEKIAGRRIPGVGWVASTADALNVVQALARPLAGAGLPGRRGKRAVVEKARHTSTGYAARVENLRRTGKLGLGVGDVLQGLQATDSLFGFGVQLGPIMGFLQDAFWLGVRGGELKARGPAWDPLGFSEAGRAACYRSPALELVHPSTYYVLANEALALWSKAGRVLPFIDLLGEHALASALVGLRLSEQVLGPWLRSGVWVDPLIDAIERSPIVRGGVRELELRDLRADQWLSRTVPATRAAVRWAIGNVRDPGRQALYESLVSSVGVGFMASVDPGARFVDQQVVGPLKDAFTVLEANRIPRFDLGE